MTRYIYNDGASDEIYEGQVIELNTYYLIQDFEMLRYAGSQKVLDAIDSGYLIVSTSADVSGHITDPAAGKAHLRTWG